MPGAEVRFLMGGQPCSHVDAIRVHLETSPEVRRLAAVLQDGGGLEPALLDDILNEAARLSHEVLEPFDQMADAQGCTLVDGRVKLAPGHEAAWQAFRDGGWNAVDLPEAFGGQGLCAPVAAAIQEIFDRGSVAFGMLPGAARAAARLLSAHAESAVRDTWVPRLASGEWAATICISEPDAGSDVGRIRTRATRAGEVWRVSGEKIWISYGDHPLADRIGHLLLARIEGAPVGTRGLSLFLVPSSLDDGQRNGVVVRRLEEKLGLHGSPTCALGLENAQALLIGEPGRGIQQLFRMIVAMRLQVGCQGLGIATAAHEASLGYASERRQGGASDAPPVAILAHPDVQRVLLRMASRIETLRGLVTAAAALSDLCEIEPDATQRQSAADLLSFLLPIVKNSAAETAFDVCSEAILVFGGAGYTREWPVERHLRNARILAIYEGTTGMQALDLVRRRIVGSPAAFEAFAAAVDRDLARLPQPAAAPAAAALAKLSSAVEWLRDERRTRLEIDAAATAALHLATHVAHGWIAARLAQTPAQSACHERLALLGRDWLARLEGLVVEPFDSVHREAARLAAMRLA